MGNFNPGWLLFVSAGAALLPILIGVGTSYAKISIVLGLLRSALGAQNLPGGLVIMTMSLALTLYLMAPVFHSSQLIWQSHDPAVWQERLAQGDFSTLAELLGPWRSFMEQHSGARELEMLRQIPLPVTAVAEAADGEATVDSLPLLAAAFLLTELREAFTMGCLILLPFLAIDLIVANILVGLGMFMVSPVMVALPLKIMLFVVADGWLLLTQALLNSYA